MCPVTLRTGCKINLFLRITGIAANGYHTLDSFFLPLSDPHDLLHISTGEKTGLHLSCSDPALDTQNNTLARAYAAFAEATSFAPNLNLRLEKGIPSGAGLGGGSSDAAALLNWLNAHAPRPLGKETLRAVALRTGADVPFFLEDVPCRVRGIGEICTPCAHGLAGYVLVLLCPEATVSTPWAYAAWDALPRSFPSSDDLTKRSAEANEMNFRVGCLVNVLEEAVFPAYPELSRLKRELFRRGAGAAAMSGSGSSIFGLFRDARKARNAAVFFRSDGMRVYEHDLQ